jgi:hypothetical protein
MSLTRRPAITQTEAITNADSILAISARLLPLGSTGGAGG